MHKEQPERWKHEHNYLPAGLRQSERNTRWVIGLTATMMVIEIAAGSAYSAGIRSGSMGEVFETPAVAE